MNDRREDAIAKLAQILGTPVYVVRTAFDEYSLVAVDSALVEAVRNARANHSPCGSDCMGHEMPRHPDGLCMTCRELIAVGRAVLAQLGAK